MQEIAPDHWVACHFHLEPGETILERVDAMGRKVDVIDLSVATDDGENPPGGTTPVTDSATDAGAADTRIAREGGASPSS